MNALHVRCENWEGLYGDGQLIGQSLGRPINIERLVALMTGKTFSLETQQASPAMVEYVVKYQGFPGRLSDLNEV